MKIVRGELEIELTRAEMMICCEAILLEHFESMAYDLVTDASDADYLDEELKDKCVHYMAERVMEHIDDYGFANTDFKVELEDALDEFLEEHPQTRVYCISVQLTKTTDLYVRARDEASAVVYVENMDQDELEDIFSYEEGSFETMDSEEVGEEYVDIISSDIFNAED